MYQALLTRRYLVSKVMPLLAALAVALCVGMVLVVWSVMGGFLAMLMASGKSMIGDVSIARPAEFGGLPYYEELVQALEAEPEVAAATPTLETLGAVILPDGDKRQAVLLGIEPEGYHAVTGYFDNLYWHPLRGEALEMARERREAELARLEAGGSPVGEERIVYDQRVLLDEQWPNYLLHGKQLAEPAKETIDPVAKAPAEGGRPPGEAAEEGDDPPQASARRADPPKRADPPRSTGPPKSADPPRRVVPAVVPGIMLSGYNERTRMGFVEPMGPTFLPRQEVTVVAVAISERGAVVETEAQPFPVANEFESGFYEADSKWLIMPLESLQRMLNMQEAKRVVRSPRVVIDPVTGEERFEIAEVVGIEPARVSQVLIRAAEGVSPQELEIVTRTVYAQVASEIAGMHPIEHVLIYTWDQKPGLRQFITAVKRETVMVVTLFSVISIVASFLIFAIFWAMISEKTKDIGVLRAIGAGKGGVAWLFLRYSLIIGMIGAAVGLIGSFFFVDNINTIHTFMAEVLGVEIWNPETYYFTEIPNNLEWKKAAAVGLGGIVFSLLGALIPALRAATMDPVKALRFE